MKRWPVILLLLVLLLMSGLTVGIFAQTTGFTLPWWTVDGGGTNLFFPAFAAHSASRR